MKQLKFAILGAGLLGLIGVFLPMVSSGKLSFSLWDVRKLAAGQVYLTMVAFIIPIAMGGMAAAKNKMLRWQSIVAAVGFALALVKVRDAFGGAIGGKVMVIAAAVGLAAAIASIAKPEAD